MPKDAVIRAVPDSQLDTDVTVQYSTLPEAEKDIVQTAVEQGLYHACPELPDAIRSFANRFGDIDTAYLGYLETTYGLYIQVTDQVYAATASFPEQEPSCGGIF
jgi:hypothetical protein